MKKIIGLTVLITLACAGLIFAQQGKGFGPGQEYPKDNKHPGYNSRNFNNAERPRVQGTWGPSIIEIKEIAGEIVIKDNDFPAIKSGRDEVKIMLPADAIKALKLTTGSKISIKGFELPAPNWSITGEKIVRVFELQYEGRKFLVHGRGPGMGGGFGI